MKKSKKIISLQEFKSTKDFINDIKSGALYEQLKPKEKTVYQNGKQK